MNLKNALTVAAAAVVVAACGGGGGGNGTVAGENLGSNSGGSVPQSALGSSSALVAYMTRLIGNSSDSAEPLTLGDITLPVDDTAESAAL
ncbi:hypothetical protein EZ313_21310 [Ramlibacter henchirensis]|uniref:Uncharacterized protein n=1 Tax=Ramlibacter henchirensis TaxID=204072 RepID=A0A4Z0BSI9_9BURK|nr:hypothetical protein [Ramlibacter henchirensis]TFZ00969.1 hypothetical protein EZ313_21310 [Ramlibacter henchirensis]